MNNLDIQYISDEQGKVTGVVVPIQTWKEILAELETQHLLQSETMRQRLLEAKHRTEGIAFETVLTQLGLEGDR
jgi:hypothetical protein